MKNPGVWPLTCSFVSISLTPFSLNVITWESSEQSIEHPVTPVNGWLRVRQVMNRELTCCLRYPFSFLNIFISRFKLRINFSLGSYNISQINQKDVTDMKQNPVEVETMEWRNKYMLNTLIKTIQVKWNWSHQLRFLSDLKFIYSKFYIFFMFLKVSFLNLVFNQLYLPFWQWVLF